MDGRRIALVRVEKAQEPRSDEASLTNDPGPAHTVTENTLYLIKAFSWASSKD